MSMQYILGTSSVQWSNVERLESKQLFLVKTADGSVYSGTLNTSNVPGARPVKIEVAETPGEGVVIDSSRIVQMDMTSEKFLQRLNGSVNTGIIYSKGNQSTQYSLGSQITYPQEQWAAGLGYKFHSVGKHRRFCVHPKPAERRCLPSPAMEQLVLRRPRHFPAKLGAGNYQARHLRRLRRTLP